ncbi:PAS domain S-box protein [Corallococcus praedator]|uniref:histidine kinase n=1 Tax=Corallococcus praedator TaxID=2316724 RepID=A0ABX9QL23_9BACT|nr:MULTISPECIES: PAS domain-containing protein [Corallococcus]RKH32027.1 PAS domain S-box protein [Corallococcus sp. CA031C]RKI12098.1 PAS domain S-box protein [Corallococcus praedator]
MALRPGQEQNAEKGTAALTDRTRHALDVLERISDAVFSFDRFWRFTYVNTRAERLLKRSRSELIGRNVWEEFPQALGSVFEQEYRRALASQANVSFEAFFWPLEAWVDVRAYPSAGGLIVFCRDISARKQAEQALHESEQFLRATLDSLSTHIAILDGRGTILAVNAAWKRFARENGCEEDSANCGVGANYLGVTDAAKGDFSEEAPSVATGIRDIIAGRAASFLQEYPCHEPGGQRRWFLVRVTRFAGQCPLRVVVAHEDITGRREAGEALLRLEREEAAREEAEAARERMDAVLERIADGFAAFDRDGRFTYVNRHAETHFGRGREAMLGQRPADVLSESQGAAIEHLLRRATGAGAPVEEDQPSARVDRWLRVVAYPAPEGHTVYFRDVTEQRRAELWSRFLSEVSAASTYSLDWEDVSRAVVKLTVPTLADGCAIATPGGPHGEEPTTEVAAVTPELEEALRAMFRPGSTSALGRTVEQALRTESVVRLPGPSQDSPRVDSAVAVPLMTQARPLGVLVLVSTRPGLRYETQDLSLVRELARRAALVLENARLYRTARQAVTTRDETLGIVSHDLRAPLNTISLLCTGAERRLSHGDSGPAVGEALRKVRAVVGDMDRLIDDLLEVARVESGQPKLDLEPLDVPTLLAQVQGLNELLAAERSLRLEVSLAPDLPRVRADRARVLRVFQNLVGNAIKFTPPGGRILLKAEHCEGRVCFCVEDTGPGIDAQEQVHVFDRFWQAIHAHKAGAGLGLAIVKGVVEAHGGRAWVESQQGQGAAFFFTLPALTQAPEVAQAPR